MLIPTNIPISESMEISKRMLGYSVVYYDATLINNYDVYIVSLDLKYEHLDRKVNMQTLYDAIEKIREHARLGSLVIIEMNVSVGTTKKLLTGLDFNCVYSGPVVNEKRTSSEIENTVKMVGGLTKESEKLGIKFFKTLYNKVKGVGSCETAETINLANLALRSLEEAFVNELSDNCSKYDVNVNDVMRFMNINTSPWIGRSIDTESQHLIMAKENEWPLLSTCSEQLCNRPTKIYKRIVEKYCGGDYDKLSKKTFLVVGIGNEIGSSNVENSPVVEVIRLLECEGANVYKHDMFIEEYSDLNMRRHYDGIIVMHPYNLPFWKKFKQTTFYCIS